MSKNQLPVPLLRREITWGLRYLLFQLVFLGYILYWLLALLGFQHDSVLLNTVYFVVNLGATLWIFRTYLWQSVKYGISHWVKLLIASAVGFVAYHALYQVLDLVIHRIEPNFFNVNDQGIYGDLEDNFVLTAVGAVALAPLAEELLYRGLVFGALQQRNRLVAYSLSTLVFCFIHIMGHIGSFPTSQLVLSFIQYIPAGLALAWAYEYSGSILAPVLIHTASNVIATIVR